MIRALIPVIRVSRQENKDLVARLIFHDADSSATCVEKKQIRGASWNLCHKLCLQRQSIFDALIIFTRCVEPRVFL